MDKLTQIILDDTENILKRINFKELGGKTILITGASGLIGTYLLASLKQIVAKNGKKIKVIAVRRNPVLPYFERLTDFPGIKIYQGDLTDDNFLKSLPKANFIIHAAGYGQPRRFLKDPLKTLRLNTDVTIGLLDKLLPGGKFLFLSSSEVYSGLKPPPYRENQIGTTGTLHPRACYIEGKKVGEMIVNLYRTKGVAAKSARLCLVYGPGTRPDDARVINSFIEQALMKHKITLLDQGKAKRAYCYVTDAVEILWQILLKGHQPIYNVGGISQVTIAELAKKIGSYLQIPVTFPKNSKRSLSGAPEEVSLDMSLVKHEFKKTNFVPLPNGLKITIAWQKILYKK